jgi:hypothetical protein
MGEAAATRVVRLIGSWPFSAGPPQRWRWHSGILPEIREREPEQSKLGIRPLGHDRRNNLLYSRESGPQAGNFEL